MRQETKDYFASRLGGAVKEAKDFSEFSGVTRFTRILFATRGMAIVTAVNFLIIASFLPVTPSLSHIGLLASGVSMICIIIFGLSIFFSTLDKSLGFIDRSISGGAKARIRREKYRSLLRRRPGRMANLALRKLMAAIADILTAAPRRVEVLAYLGMSLSVIGIGQSGLMLPSIVAGSFMLLTFISAGLLLSLIPISKALYWTDIWFGMVLRSIAGVFGFVFNVTLSPVADAYVARRLGLAPVRKVKAPKAKGPGIFARMIGRGKAAPVMAAEPSIAERRAAAESQAAPRREMMLSLQGDGLIPVDEALAWDFEGEEEDYEGFTGRFAEPEAQSVPFGDFPRSLIDAAYAAESPMQFAEANIHVPKEIMQPQPTLASEFGWRIVYSRRGRLGAIKGDQA